MDKKKIVLILGLVALVLMVNCAVFLILPSISKNADVIILPTSVIIIEYMLPFALFQMLCSFLENHLRKRQALAFSFFLIIVFAVLCSLTIPTLVSFRVITGMVASAIYTVIIRCSLNI
jgi:MFS family permease